MGNFPAFWAAYPRRVARIAAEKAYRKALQRTTHEQIMAGVEAYKRHKPDYADWAHAASWLNAGRWDDEWTDNLTVAPAEPKEDWYENCGRLHNHECGLNQMKHHTRKILEEGKAVAS